MAKTTGQRKGRVFYGYWLLAVTFLFLVLFNGSGVFVFSLFVHPLGTALGWGRGEVMAGFTVFYATLGVASPLVGRFVDRYGARLVIPAGALVMGLGFMIVSQMSSLPLFYVGYAVVGAGAAGTGPVPCSAIITNWFKRQRGLALGLMAAGIGAGGPVMAPFIGYMLSDYDWRMSYLSLAVVLIVVIVPLSLAMVRTRPSEMGLYPDGASAPIDEHESRKDVTNEADSFTLKQASRTRAFWFISVASVFYAFGSMGAIQASVPFLEDIGYPTAMAAGAIGAIGFGSAVGKILFGRLCDKMQPNYAFAIGAGLLLAGALVLLTVQSSSPVVMIWAYALLLGIGAGAWLPTLSTLASSRFGVLHYGAVFGAIHLWLSLGTAVGPFFSGVMYDALGSYRAAFIIFAVLLALALPTILLIGKPTRPPDS